MSLRGWSASVTPSVPDGGALVSDATVSTLRTHRRLSAPRRDSVRDTVQRQHKSELLLERSKKFSSVLGQMAPSEFRTKQRIADEEKKVAQSRLRARERWRILASNMDVAMEKMRPKPRVWTLPSITITRSQKGGSVATRVYGGAVLVWNVVLWLAVITSYITIPITVGFEPTSPWALIPLLAHSSICTLIFVFDMFIKALTQYIADGVIVTSPRETCRHWLWSPWPIVDVLAAIPIYEIGLAIEYGGDTLTKGFDAPLSPATVMLRLARLIRLLKYAEVWHIPSLIVGVRGITSKLVQMALHLVMVSHLMSSIWFLTARAVGFGDDHIETLTWITKYNDGQDMTVEGSTSFELYLVALYWSIVTLSTLGYGDITPANGGERIVCLMAVVIGSIFYTSLVGTLTAFASNRNASARIFTEKVESLEEFMKASRLPHNLRSDIRFHFASSFSDRVYFKDGDLIADLNGRLRQRIVESRVTSLLRQTVPCLKQGSAELMERISNAMVSRYFLPDEYLCRVSDVARELFVLRRGEVLISTPHIRASAPTDPLDAKSALTHKIKVRRRRTSASIIGSPLRRAPTVGSPHETRKGKGGRRTLSAREESEGGANMTDACDQSVEQSWTVIGENALLGLPIHEIDSSDSRGRVYRDFSCRTLTLCTVEVLSRESLHAIANDFPDLAARLRRATMRNISRRTRCRLPPITASLRVARIGRVGVKLMSDLIEDMMLARRRKKFAAEQSARGGESDEEKSTSRGGSPKDAASGGAESAEFTVNCSAPTVEASTATIVAELGDLRADVASMREASHVRDRKLDFILAFVKEMAKTD